MTILFHGTTLSELTDGALNAATRETTASLIGPYVSGGVKMFGDDLGSEFTFTDDGDIWATIYHATDSDAGDFEFFELRDDSTSLLRMQHTGSSQRLQ